MDCGAKCQRFLATIIKFSAGWLKPSFYLALTQFLFENITNLSIPYSFTYEPLNKFDILFANSCIPSDRFFTNFSIKSTNISAGSL